MKTLSNRISWRPCAFSLIELLVVIAIIGVLAALGTPAFFSSQKSTALTRAGNEFVDAVAFARQMAVSKSTITCLVLVADPATVGAQQAITVLEYDQVLNDWKPMLSWLHLPEVARIVDLTSAANVASSNQAANALAPINLRLNGQQLSPSQFSTVLFYPEGAMESGNAPSRRFSARLLTESSESASDSLPNYYDVVINADTSAFRVLRP